MAETPPRGGTADTGAFPIAVSIVRTSVELAVLEKEWNALHEASAHRNPFLTYDWTLACWAAMHERATLFVAVARECGRLVAIAPLCIERKAGFRVLRFIADDRSDYLGFLTPADDHATEHVLLGELMAFENEWDLALFKPLTDSYTSLRTAFSNMPRTHETQWTRAPYCSWRGDWESLHKEGPSWFREMRKRTRRFHRDGHRVGRFAGLEAVVQLPVVSEIEAHSWKGRLGTARLQAGAGRELLARAFTTLGCRGQMQLWLAYVDEQAVAFQIDFVLKDRLWHYQCAYDEEFRQTRAGSVLAYASLENGWANGVREFDYLSGEEPYKLERTTASRAIYHLAAHSAGPRGLLAYWLLAGIRWRLRQIRVVKIIYERMKAARRSLRNLARA